MLPADAAGLQADQASAVSLAFTTSAARAGRERTVLTVVPQ